MLERISNIIRRVMDRFYPSEIDRKDLMQAISNAREQHEFEIDVCNHCRDPWGYCCKCGNSQ